MNKEQFEEKIREHTEHICTEIKNLTKFGAQHVQLMEDGDVTVVQQCLETFSEYLVGRWNAELEALDSRQEPDFNFDEVA